LGEGSTFRIEIEFKKAEHASRILIPPQLEGKHVLIVDDNKVTLDALNKMLTSMSFIATAVSTTPEATQCIVDAEKNGVSFDFILVDYMTPIMNGIHFVNSLIAENQLNDVNAIVMIEHGQDEAQDPSAITGTTEFLFKPVSPSFLIHAFADASGIKTEPTHTSLDSISREKLISLTAAKVLLVEDNELNQEVAIGLLSKAGIRVDTVYNGFEAVNNASSDYDAILMDLQMPLMDGYEATKLIRKESKYANLPIIAMTANVMRGEKEKCLAMGMNDIIAKPIDASIFFATLNKWIRTLNLADEYLLSEQQPGEKALLDIPGIDTAGGLARIGGDPDLYRSLIFRFKKNYGESIKHIRQLLEQDNEIGVERAVHTLKGVAGNIGMTALYSATTELEKAVETKNQELINNQLENSAKELSTIINTLDHINEPIPEEKTKKKYNKEEVGNLLERLKPLISQHDLGAIELIALLSQYEYKDDTPLKSIDKFISVFDFKGAKLVLEDFIENLNSGSI
jgi:two-component system sensor histidine kinase/response regulator